MKAKKNDLRYIGFVRKVGGFHGGVMLAVENGEPEDYENAKFFFLEMEGKPVPFAVEEVEMKRNDFIVKFEDVNSAEAAKKLVTKKIFVEKAHAQDDEEGEELTWTDLIGYTAFDGEAELGVIDGVEEYPQQWIARIMVKGKEVLIPLNEDTVVAIDDEQNKITLDLPEGLLDLYR